MRTWLFHVEHNARPELAFELLELIERRPEASVEALLDAGADAGLAIGTTVRSAQNVAEGPLRRLQELGLVAQDAIRLTNAGAVVAGLLHAGEKADLLHHLHYSLWDSAEPEANCFSWSYGAVCDWLWNHDEIEVDVQAVAAAIVALADEELGRAGVSFSHNSVRGVLHWLGVLQPPVLTDANGSTRYQRREFCSPALLTSAVDRLYRREHVAYQSNLTLNEDRVTRLCRACQLVPDSLPRVLEWATARFPFLQAPGGRFVVLERAVAVEDWAA